MSRLTLLDPGLAASIQDRGRFGLRRCGVPLSGALDPLLLAAANALLGNDEQAAGLEILLRGPAMQAQDAVAVALAGDIAATIDRAGGDRETMPPWRGVRLAPGDCLRVGAPAGGIGYLALSGGVGTAPVLGSRSHYGRAGLGQSLTEGLLLPCGRPGRTLTAPPWRHQEGPIRLLAGPQDDHFTAAALERLVSADWRVAPDSDRMGLRLLGPALKHNDKGAEILTDGVLPGVIQVPAGGQPILLLADAQTSGGYAKIATVIAADLPRLGARRAGDAVRFAWVDPAGAAAALADRRRRFDGWRQALAPVGLDAAALYRENLISGATAGEDDQ